MVKRDEYSKKVEGVTSFDFFLLYISVDESRIER